MVLRGLERAQHRTSGAASPGRSLTSTSTPTPPAPSSPSAPASASAAPPPPPPPGSPSSSPTPPPTMSRSTSSAPTPTTTSPPSACSAATSTPPSPRKTTPAPPVSKVRQQIDQSPSPHLPLLWTEWNVPGANKLRDTPYVGPALAEAVRTCDGKVDALSFWTFSDVFEEGGPASTPFNGEFGLRALGGINKASFYDFALLHQLGTQRLAQRLRPPPRHPPPQRCARPRSLEPRPQRKERSTPRRHPGPPRPARLRPRLAPGRRRDPRQRRSYLPGHGQPAVHPLPRRSSRSSARASSLPPSIARSRAAASPSTSAPTPSISSPSIPPAGRTRHGNNPKAPRLLPVPPVAQDSRAQQGRHNNLYTARVCVTTPARRAMHPCLQPPSIQQHVSSRKTLANSCLQAGE